MTIIDPSIKFYLLRFQHNDVVMNEISVLDDDKQNQ